MAAGQGRRIDAVVIGASAGGLEALSLLLPAFRPDCGVPVLVVVHLPRERPSLLPEVLSPKCRLPVMEAQDKQPLAPSTIFVAPPDYHLLVDQGPQLALSSDELVHYSRPSVDVLFESAADVYGNALLGVILSGANSDGAAGLRCVEQQGGLTLVQSPSSALASAMPLAALAATSRSAVLDPYQLAEVVGAIEKGALAAGALA